VTLLFFRFFVFSVYSFLYNLLYLFSRYFQSPFFQSFCRLFEFFVASTVLSPADVLSISARLEFGLACLFCPNFLHAFSIRRYCPTASPLSRVQSCTVLYGSRYLPFEGASNQWNDPSIFYLSVVGFPPGVCRSA